MDKIFAELMPTNYFWNDINRYLADHKDCEVKSITPYGHVGGDRHTDWGVAVVVGDKNN